MLYKVQAVNCCYEVNLSAVSAISTVRYYEVMLGLVTTVSTVSTVKLCAVTQSSVLMCSIRRNIHDTSIYHACMV